MGGTGNMRNVPVPSGYQPAGMATTRYSQTTVGSDGASFPFRTAGCRPEQAGSLCYPRLKALLRILHFSEPLFARNSHLRLKAEKGPFVL